MGLGVGSEEVGSFSRVERRLGKLVIRERI